MALTAYTGGGCGAATWRSGEHNSTWIACSCGSSSTSNNTSNTSSSSCVAANTIVFSLQQLRCVCVCVCVCVCLPPSVRGQQQGEGTVRTQKHKCIRTQVLDKAYLVPSGFPCRGFDPQHRKGERKENTKTCVLHETTGTLPTPTLARHYLPPPPDLRHAPAPDPPLGARPDLAPPTRPDPRLASAPGLTCESPGSSETPMSRSSAVVVADSHRGRTDWRCRELPDANFLQIRMLFCENEACRIVARTSTRNAPLGLVGTRGSLKPCQQGCLRLATQKRNS